MDKKFSRNCPDCFEEILYTIIKNRNKAEKKKKRCKKCVSNANKEKNRSKMEFLYLKFDEERNYKIIEIFNVYGSNWSMFKKNVTDIFKKFIKETKENPVLSRKCPNCSQELFYKNRDSVIAANKKNCLCKHCSRKGSKNPFFGKKHTDESKSKRLKTLETSELWKESVKYKQSDEYKQYFKENFSGENSSRFGKGTLKEIWTKKYGIEEAEIRHKNWTDKLSVSLSGENNHMYGKPSPVGSGNGWSGWYNGWYFRSLRELSYMINEIEGKDLSWENGEQKKYKIPYIDWNGTKRNYFPDFVVENKYMIECKPLRLHESASVICKKRAANEFCQKLGLEYVLVEPIIISTEEIKGLYDLGKIKFLPKYEEKFLQYMEK